MSGGPFICVGLFCFYRTRRCDRNGQPQEIKKKIPKKLLLNTIYSKAGAVTKLLSQLLFSVVYSFIFDSILGLFEWWHRCL